MAVKISGLIVQLESSNYKKWMNIVIMTLFELLYFLKVNSKKKVFLLRFKAFCLHYQVHKPQWCSW